MSSIDENDKTRIVTNNVNANSEENKASNDATKEEQSKKNNLAKDKKSSGISKGAFAAGVGGAAIGGVAAGTVFSDEIKGVFHHDDASTASTDGAIAKAAQQAAAQNSTSNEIPAPNTVDDQSNEPITNASASNEMHSKNDAIPNEMQSNNEAISNEMHVEYADNEGHYEVSLIDLDGDGNPDSMSVDAELVDGSHITFSASGTALTELMQNEEFELAEPTDYIQEASLGSFEGFDEMSVGATGYDIKSGDTLSEIAEAHGTSVAHIMELNPDIDDPNVIMAGDHILIPENDNVSGVYEGWRPEWSNSSDDLAEEGMDSFNVDALDSNTDTNDVAEEVYSDSFDIEEGAYSDSFDIEEDYSDTSDFQLEDSSYDTMEYQSDSNDFDVMDGSSYDYSPEEDYSSFLDQEDFANYDSQDSYFDSGDMDGFDY